MSVIFTYQWLLTKLLNNTKYHNYQTKCKKLKLKYLKRYMTENGVAINLVLASFFSFFK